MKSRLTITLSESTLAKIDSLIDKKNIRSRSHAIEHLIEKNFQPAAATAVLLAGGKGKGSSKIGTPKPLTLIDDKPLIIHTIELLKKYNVEQLIIVTDKTRTNQLKKVLDKGQNFGIKIDYVTEKTPQGTAGAIRLAAKKLPNQPFFVLHGDIITTINLNQLFEFHTRNKGLITVAVKPRATQKTFDNVSLQGHTVVDFQPSRNEEAVSIVNAGVYIFEPEALRFIPEKQTAMLETDVFPKLVKSQQVLAFPFQGVWFDIDTDTNYQQALGLK